MNIYQIIAIIAGAILLVSGIVLTIVLLKRKAKDNSGREYPNLLDALGGKENISSLNCKGSRISVVVIDKKIVDKEKIKLEGIETIVVSNKKVTMVVDNKIAVLMFDYLNNVSDKKELV